MKSLIYAIAGISSFLTVLPIGYQLYALPVFLLSIFAVISIEKGWIK